MGFINQFPYSDFHELNIDWVIKQTKDNVDAIKTLQDIISQIEVLTEDQINAMISSAIASNNTILYAAMVDLKNQITSEYITYCDNKIASLKTTLENQLNQLKIYVDNQDIHYYDLAKAYADNVLVQAKDYTDHAVLDYTMMVNPITGVYEDVRNVVNDIVTYFHTDGSLTAAEYDALELTATVYDAYELTAYDYDFNGKNLLV